MRINLRYQLILFSSFELQASLDVISRIRDSLNDEGLNVTPMVETIIGVGPTGTTNVGRPRFASHDGAFSFYVKSDCLAFEWVNANIGVTEVLPFDSFCKRVIEICEKVSYFSQHNYRRVGLIRNTFIDEIDHQVVFQKFNNVIKFYNGREMKDWNCFFPAKAFICDSIEVNATSRIQHLTTNVKRDSIAQVFDGISIISDINTLNLQDKYSFSEVRQIISELKSIEYQITNETYNVITDYNS